MEEHGVKLVHQKSNRVWKDGAADLAKARFGPACYTKPEFIGPAVLEKLGAAEAAFVKEFAYSPVGNLTVARLSDKRAAVRVVPASEVFAGAIAAIPLDSGEDAS